MKDGKIKDVRIQLASKQVEITITSGKERINDTIAYNDNINLVKKGLKCQYELVKKRITKLVVDGVDVMEVKPNKKSNQARETTEKRTSVSNSYPHSPRTKPGDKKNRYQNGSQYQGNCARAPYNFVPVNKIVVEAPEYSGSYKDNQKDICIVDGKIPSFDRYHEGLYTGFINLDIETLTPLYIRDTYTEDEERRAAEAREHSEKWENPDFFSPGGAPRIPGSSLRGMTRNLVEIVSCSRMEYVENSVLYYRSMADECRSIKNEYFKIMGQRGRDKNRPGYKFKAGYLQRNGDKYQIIPAKKQNGQQYKRTPKANRPDFSWHWQSEGSCITVSGPAPSEKKEDWLINPIATEAKPIIISQTDLNSYCNDINRLKDKSNLSEADKKDGDLMRWLRVEENKENSKNMVPCFYVDWKDEEGNNHVSFGHTAYFRLAYHFSIKEHLPQLHLIDDKALDLTNAIFGQASNFAGRVFFQDAHINKKDLEKVSKEEIYLNILSTPKPTTFQHYLEQGGRNKNTLKHWNDKEGILRGYKMYWHRKTPPNGNNAWQASAEEVSKSLSQYTKIKPVGSGCHFTGRIHFENLSTIELGALLFILDLPVGCAHKIGMGKPLGLGSIRITPTLTLSRRTNTDKKISGRYERLFEKQGWYLAEDTEKDIQQYKEAFAGYMLKQTEKKDINANKSLTYWNTDRMKELRAMLDFDKNTAADNWLDKTRYMELDKFKKRPVLPTPSEIIHLAGIDYE